MNKSGSRLVQTELDQTEHNYHELSYLSEIHSRIDTMKHSWTVLLISFAARENSIIIDTVRYGNSNVLVWACTGIQSIRLNHFRFLMTFSLRFIVFNCLNHPRCLHSYRGTTGWHVTSRCRVIIDVTERIQPTQWIFLLIYQMTLLIPRNWYVGICYWRTF